MSNGLTDLAELTIVYFTNNYSFIIQCYYLLKSIIIIDYEVYVLILLIYISYLILVVTLNS